MTINEQILLNVASEQTAKLVVEAIEALLRYITEPDERLADNLNNSMQADALKARQSNEEG